LRRGRAFAKSLWRRLVRSITQSAEVPRRIPSTANVALRHAMKLHEWYEKFRPTISRLTNPLTHEMLSYHFNHLLAIFYRPSLWILTNIRSEYSLERIAPIATLFRPTTMVLHRSMYGGLYVGLFKHPFELSITLSVRIRRYFTMKGHRVDIKDYWNMILNGNWKHLKLNENGSISLKQFSDWIDSRLDT